MWWHLSRQALLRGNDVSNREALRTSGDPPGLLIYARGQPVGWCAVAPRQTYPALQRSRILKPVDNRPVWSVPCLFVAKPYRRRKISLALLRAAVAHAALHDATIVEGYPIGSRTGREADPFARTGTAAAFRHAGFTEVARRSPARPVMRYTIPVDPPGM